MGKPSIQMASSTSKARSPEELENLLTYFYSRYNPEKLSTLKTLVTQFFGKEETLNQLLRERYKADLNDIVLSVQGNPDVAESMHSHSDTDPHASSAFDDESNRQESLRDNRRWESTMNSIDEKVSKVQNVAGESANLSAIVHATSKALKAALQENQELKVLNTELCAQLEQRDQMSGDAQVRAEEVEEALSKAREKLASRREEIDHLRLILQEAENEKLTAMNVQAILRGVLEAKESDPTSQSVVKLLQDQVERAMKSIVVKDNELHLLKEQRNQMSRQLEVLQACNGFTEGDSVRLPGGGSIPPLDDQGPLIPGLETIFERNSVASDWESNGRASPRVDLIPTDWDGAPSSSPLEKERSPGVLDAAGTSSIEEKVGSAEPGKDKKDSKRSQGRSFQEGEDISDQVKQLRQELEASVRQQQALAEFWSSEKEKFAMMEHENHQLKKLLSSSRLKQGSNLSPLTVAQHNLIGMTSDYEGKQYAQPGQERMDIASGSEALRNHRVSSEPPAGSKQNIQLGPDMIPGELHRSSPGLNKPYWNDVNRPGFPSPPAQGVNSSMGNPNSITSFARAYVPGQKNDTDSSWADQQNLQSSEWGSPSGSGSATPSSPGLWQTPRRRVAQHVPASPNRMMSPTPSNPEDDTMGPGFGRGSPARSHDGGAHDTLGMTGAGEPSESTDSGQIASAISDESLLQALYHANLTRV